MKYIKIPKRYAEVVKKHILGMNILNPKRNILHNKTYVYLPLKNYTKQDIKKLSELMDINITIIKKKTTKENEKKQKQNSVEVLRNPDIAKGYDLLGNVAIIEIRNHEKDKCILLDAKKVARTILKSDKNISTVLTKAGPITGQFRTRKFGYLAGKRTYIVTYKENGAIFRFDVRRVFFSNRLSYERGRINSLVKKGEYITVPFAGVGPFPIVIAKNNEPIRILAIEINKYAYDYMKENISLNKLDKTIVPVKGDVRKIAKKYKGLADRVIMQMPTQSMEFLDELIILAKDKATSHLYLFCNSIDGIKKAKKEIRKFMNNRGYSVRYLFDRKVRTYSKDVIEAVIDIRFWKRKI